MGDSSLPQTDTPIAPQSFPPPSRSDVVKGFIGDLARPFAIIATSLAASIATVIVAMKSTPDLAGAAIFIGAVFTGVGALFGAKAWENAKTGRQAADIEIAKANSGTPS